MDNSDYIKRLGAPIPRPNRPAIYDKLITDGATGVISTISKAIHRAGITNWDGFKAAEI